MGRVVSERVAKSVEDARENPLNTSLGPGARRIAKLTPPAPEATLEISDSAFAHVELSTLSEISRIAEKHSGALRCFPKGSKLVLSAKYEFEESTRDFDFGGTTSFSIYCHLKYPAENGSFKHSGRELIYYLGGKTSPSKAFESYVRNLIGKG